MNRHCRIRKVFNLIFILVFLSSLVGIQPVRAQTPPPVGKPTPSPAGLRYGYDSETGKMNFAGGDASTPLLAAGQTLGALSDSAAGEKVLAQAAEKVLAQYAAAFGLNDPAKDLRLERVEQHTQGGPQGATLRYQQQYNGIPVLGGELLLNRDAAGNVLSLNGEVSPNLSLRTTRPAVSSQKALQTTLAGMKSWYGIAASALQSSQPALWIYDPHILQPDSPSSPVLVWRVEITSVAKTSPINELVLINATTGRVALHFNQVSQVQENGIGQEGGPETPMPPADPPAEPAPPPAAQTSGTAWYVTFWGNDAYDCTSPAAPCETINGALQKAVDGDTVRIAAGIYTGDVQDTVMISISVDLQGGWNEDFTVQDGYTTLDGQNAARRLLQTTCCSTNQVGHKVSLTRMILTRANDYALSVAEYTDFTIRDSSFHHNQKSAIKVYSYAKFTAINITVTKNNAPNEAGGLVVDSALEVNLQNITIAYNTGGYGYGSGGSVDIHCNLNYCPQTIFHIKNSILAKNSGTSSPDCYIDRHTTMISDGYNLIGNSQGCKFTPAAGDILNQDPLLDRFSPLGFYPLLPGSPAIDAGSPADPGSGGTACELQDQLGALRPVDGSGDGTAMCDMGAYENQALHSTNSIKAWDGASQAAPLHKDYQPLVIRAISPDGQPLVGAEITFTAPESGPSGTFASSHQASVIADADGLAAAPTFTANDITGSFVVEAALVGAPAQVQFKLENYIAQPGTIQRLAGNGQMANSQGVFPQQLRAQVLDATHHRPYAGIPVTFTAPASGPGGTFAGTSANFTTVLTGADGIATAPVFTANLTSGGSPYSVTAQTPGVDAVLTYRLINLDNLNIYVSPKGSDKKANTCRFPETPCLTLNNAFTLAQPGTTIWMQSGIYPEHLGISKNINISGGWDASYTTLTGQSVLLSTTQFENTGIYVGSFIQTTVSGVTLKNFYQGVYTLGRITLSNCAAVNNYKGVYIQINGDASINNCTISGNDFGIYASSKSTSINFSTIVDNETAIITDNLKAILTIKNSILARNVYYCSENSGSIRSGGYNVFDADLCKDYNGPDTDQYNVDPRISPLLDDRYFALAVGSPAIDAADPQAECPAMDMRGIDRPVKGQCDIGSFEFIAPEEAATLVALPPQSQTTLPGLFFLSPLRVLALDSAGSLVPGAVVTFNLPDSGASAIFTPISNYNVSITTGEDAIAISPDLRANDQTGIFTASAVLKGTPQSVSFELRNGSTGLYVDSTQGNDQSNTNDCRTLSAPCKSIKNAIQHAAADEIIYLAAGTYTDTYQNVYNSSFAVVHLDRDLIFSGGWDPTFTIQNGRSELNGGKDNFGLYFWGSVRAMIDRVDFSHNRTGIYNSQGTLDLYHSRITQNKTALYTSANTRVFDSAITDNRLGVSNSRELTLTNVTLSHNTCYEENDLGCGSTAGLFNYGTNATAKLNHVTIADNKSFANNPYNHNLSLMPGGISNLTGSVLISNSILAYNQGTIGYDCGGTLTSLGHNLIGNNLYCQVQAAEGDIIGDWDHPVDPRLGYIGDYGGGLETVPLLSGSPAIDSADPSTCPEKDLRGVPRPVGAGCDMGTYEGTLESDPLPRIMTFDSNYTDYPRRFLCESPQTDCTGGQNLQADRAHQYALGAYQTYRDLYGWESIDNAGMPVISTVRYVAENAFWTGQQMVFGEGYALADDVVAHEFTHGVTDYTSHLMYYYQSGAISESFSDMWGEYYDQTNGLGNDAAGVRWLMGEDLPKGANRSMSNPPLFRHPDRMSSTLYWLKPSDNGGVHANSGVNNKAVYLMVDGGKFNGLSMTPLGWRKTLAVYFYAQTHLLTSGAGYDDLYQALNQSCSVLTEGAEGITTADCQQVRKALDAVQMSQSHKAAFNPEPPACPTGTSANPERLFFDDFENGDGSWTFGVNEGNQRWSVVPGNTRFYYAASGKHALYGDDYGNPQMVSDTYAAMKTGVVIPKEPGTVLYFKHSFGLEYGFYRGAYYFIDGGVLEYTLDDGSTWQDAKSLYEAGTNYTSRLYNYAYGGRNPLHGRIAFAAESHGYVASRYNLTALIGRSVRFRWRLGTDYVGYGVGWAVDDVAIYTCVSNPAVPELAAPDTGSLQTTNQPNLDWHAAANAVRYELEVASDANFTTLLRKDANIPVEFYTFRQPLASNSRYYWRVRAINSIGVTSSWSPVRNFRTALTPPVLDAPANGSTTESRRPIFAWNPSPGAISYTLQISGHDDMATPFINGKVIGNSYTPSMDLPAARPLYWRMRADGVNPSAWSEVYSFTTP
jgi:Zn-dependent metalloprotease